MLASYIIYGGILILTLFYLYFKRVFSYWNNRNVLSINGTIPFGNLQVGSKNHSVERFQEFYEKFKGQDIFCGFYFLVSPIIIVLDLDFLRNFLVKDFGTFHDRGVYVNEKNDPISANLFALSGDKWKSMRNKLSPTFTSGKLKQMFSIITNYSEELRNYVGEFAKNNEIIDIKNVSGRFTVDVIASCAFGFESNALKNKDVEPEILTKADCVFRAGAMRSLYFFFINVFQKFSKFLGLRAFPKLLSDFIENIVQDTVNYREANKIQRNDFMNILIQMKNSGQISGDEKTETVGKITLNELTAEAFVFFFAGFETSSTTISFCLHELSVCYDIQEKTRNEINKVLEKYDGEINYEAIMEMTYLEQVVNETLRKYPAVGFIMRVANKDYPVPNTEHIIEKGIQVFVPTYAIHRDANIYPDPEKFDPDRFTPENIRNRHPFSFLPFGEGPRVCIGMRFAMILVKVGLVSLLTHFKFTVNQKTVSPLKLDPTNDPNMSIKGGIWLNVEEI